MISSTNSSLLSLSLPKSSTGEKQQLQLQQSGIDFTSASFLSKNKYEKISNQRIAAAAAALSPPIPIQQQQPHPHPMDGPADVLLNRIVSPPPSSQSYLRSSSRLSSQEIITSASINLQMEQQARELNVINEMNRIHRKSPFPQRREFVDYGNGSPKKESTLSSIGKSSGLIRIFIKF
jgi:hypothetical protein